MDGIRSILSDSITQAGLLQKLSPAYVVVAMSVALICGIIIYGVYKLFFRGAVYSENFNILLIITTLVTSFIIMTISSNLVLSLGMVGALSIVRFRAAVKDPLDVGFLFWAVAAGLTSGAGLFPFAVVGTIFVAIVYIILTLVRVGKHSYLLIVKYNDSAEEKVAEEMKSAKSRLKNKTKLEGRTELTVQIKLGKDTSVLNRLQSVDGVTSAVLVEFTGDNV